ncbi:MAG: biotin--[acetyl-CoA-carboxylase] ligase [Firmicutes bacterium]|nr:biotin--[acetyl-CoA-carboxylase] ligase [Bacillota bacterium]
MYPAGVCFHPSPFHSVSCWPGDPGLYFPVIGSTNTWLRQAAQDGLPVGTWVFAAIQRGGRGRQGRFFTSPVGGLWTSFLLTLFPQTATLYPLVIGIAAAEMVERSSGLEVSLRWPNDLLVHGEKVGGILCETISFPRAQQKIVCGVGIDVNVDPMLLPPGSNAVSALCGRSLSSHDAAWGLYERIEAWSPLLEQPETLRHAVSDAFHRRDMLYGQWVRILPAQGETVVEGEACGIDDSGALLVRAQSKKILRFTAGDVRRIRPSHPS